MNISAEFFTSTQVFQFIKEHGFLFRHTNFFFFPQFPLRALWLTIPGDVRRQDEWRFGYFLFNESLFQNAD